MNYFETLNNINVSDKTEKKNNLTYLSWAWAWGELKKKHPDATYTVYENDLGWNYHTDNKTCWVKTGVTVNGVEHIEYLPVMDFRNKSINLENVTSFEVNKTIQRSLTKAVARHGLGLYIYAGEDLPEDDEERKKQEAELNKTKTKLIDKVKAEALVEKSKKLGVSAKEILDHYKIGKLGEMTTEQWLEYNGILDKKAKEIK